LTLLLRDINVLGASETVRLDYIDKNNTFVQPRTAGFNASNLDTVRWVMKIGKTYRPRLSASFDLGVDGVPLSLENRGELSMTIQWGVQVYVDDFFLVGCDSQIVF
jgi:hypothetical protein